MDVVPRVDVHRGAGSRRTGVTTALSAGLSKWGDHGYRRPVLPADQVAMGVVGVRAPARGVGTDVRGVVYELGLCELRRVDSPGMRGAI